MVFVNAPPPSVPTVSFKFHFYMVHPISATTNNVLPLVNNSFTRQLHVPHTVAVVSFFHRLPADARDDLTWWARFLPRWNGVAMMIDDRYPIHIWTDACGRGIGFYASTGEWLDAAIPPALERLRTASTGVVESSLFELFGLLVAVVAITRQHPGRHLILHCDNTGAVAMVARSNGPSRQLATLVRALAFAAAATSCTYQVEYIPGELNTVADALSRADFQVSTALASAAASGLRLLTLPSPAPRLERLLRLGD